MKYLQLMRVKHYTKNLLVFIPIFFAQGILQFDNFIRCFVGFIGFCLISSAVYIINDYKDIEKDRMHPRKKNRPLASGAISKSVAIFFFFLCVVASVGVNLLLQKPFAILYVLGYLVLNIFYSFGLKNVPVVDIIILASGFVIRIFYGAFLTNTVVSGWLYLVICTGAIYMGLGKRRNEMKLQSENAQSNGSSREVLKYYTYAFLDKNMYVCVALVDAFYALWTMDLSDSRMRWTVPIFIIILMKYSLDVEGEIDGDPVEVIMKDKILIVLTVLYGLVIFGLLYLC